MDKEELKRRTKQFALRVLRLVDALPPTRAGRAIGDQLVRCGPAVGANYRSACRARSRKEWIARLGIVEEEADESAYWLELVMEAGMLSDKQVQPLWQEASELTAIMASAYVTSSRTPVKSR